MRLSEILMQESCIFGCSAATQESLIREMAKKLYQCGCVDDLEKFVLAVHAREAEFSTAIGEGLAIPHGKCNCVRKAGLAFASIPDGVDYQSFDGVPVTIAFMVAAPMEADDLHLRILGAIARKMVYEETKEALKTATCYEDVIKVFEEIDIK